MILARIGYLVSKKNVLYRLVGIMIFSAWMVSCQSSGNTIDETLLESGDYIAVGQDSLSPAMVRSWFIPDGPEQFLRPLTWDLQHQKIWVRFDFPKRTVLGQTELLLTSISNSNSELIVDAKEMQIHSVLNLHDDRSLSFVQDSASILISLPETYFRGDSLFIRIEYTATPPARGMYFVNPVYAVNWSPRQIYTLGQPEDNSYWLPTIDHPAERATQETWISVPLEYQTLSNGALIYSRIYEGDSLRTDYWNMDKAHAPYLFALAVGKYDVTEDFRDGIIYRYYTEPEYTPYVRDIYDGTTEMVRFFSEKLGIEYQWGVYSQAPIQEFVAGGMENTTATFLFNGVQLTPRQLVDRNYHDLIAHEVIHHWFGNLVTARNWSNLTLNEGFATYFETLYIQHAKGIEASSWKNVQDRKDYLKESQHYRRPLIFNRYASPEDLFDSHTYQKGALVLRMLHHITGDDVWWGALNRYLSENAFSSVDWTDLKTAFEQESGKLNQSFFDQWFLSPGHPEIQVQTNFTGNQALLRLTQTQDFELIPLYDLSIDIHYTDEIGESFVRQVDFFTADTVYVFDNSTGKIGELVVDPYRIVLAEFEEELSVYDLISRLAHPSVALRYEAIMSLTKLIDTNPELILPIFVEAYNFELNPHLREILLSSIAPFPQYWQGWINDLTHNVEPWYKNRILAAWMSLEHFGRTDNAFLLRLLDDPSYYVEEYVKLLLSASPDTE
jgi:aminopeptidase N